MIDLGDPVPLSVTIRNAAGAAQNADAVTLTVTLPDLTTASPTVTNTAPGIYEATYVPTQVGHHLVRWVATGANASAYTDTFDVDPSPTNAIVSLADVKAHLNITGTSNDDELRRLIDVATEWVESRIGPVVRRTLTETATPAGGNLFLAAPVISVSSMTSAYGVYTPANWTADGSTLVANYGTATYAWPVTVTYDGGYIVVPAAIRQAALIVIKGMWDDQRGPAFSPEALAQGMGDTAQVPGMGLTYWRAEQLLAPYRKFVVA